jgi:polyisoprenoid-binding protein YceI
VAVQDWLGRWQLDPDRTELRFRSPTFWGLAKVKGSFTRVDGSGEATAPNLISGRIEIDAGSVSTGIGKRDEHLRSADFFDVERYPTIVASVSSAGLTDTDTVHLHVQLEVKGTPHLLDLPVTVTALDGGTAIRLTTATTLNRRELGVDGNLLGMMADTTEVEAAAVFVKQS